MYIILDLFSLLDLAAYEVNTFCFGTNPKTTERNNTDSEMTHQALTAPCSA